jgi:hypothetical protein
VDGPSSIAAARAVGHQREGQVTARGHSRMDLEAFAGPCTPHALSPAELPVPAEGLVSVLPGPASAPAPALVPRALASVAQVA